MRRFRAAKMTIDWHRVKMTPLKLMLLLLKWSEFVALFEACDHCRESHRLLHWGDPEHRNEMKSCHDVIEYWYSLMTSCLQVTPGWKQQ